MAQPKPKRTREEWLAIKALGLGQPAAAKTFRELWPEQRLDRGAAAGVRAHREGGRVVKASHQAEEDRCTRFGCQRPATRAIPLTRTVAVLCEEHANEFNARVEARKAFLAQKEAGDGR